MPDQLDNIIQKMIDAGESEEDIGLVIQDYNNTYPVKDTIPKYTGPDTFGGGFKQSLTSGEALKSGLQGGLGYLKGAVLDIPSSIGGALKTIAGMYSNPQETGQQMYEGLKNLPNDIMNKTEMAGSDPESFGRMIGGYTGQPLATAGLSRVAPNVPGMIPPTIRGMGKPVEMAGKMIGREGAVSGMLPPFTTPRYLKVGERAIGRGVEALGQKMQKVGLKPPAAPLMDDITVKGDFLTAEMDGWLKNKGFIIKDIGRDGNITYTKPRK